MDYVVPNGGVFDMVVVNFVDAADWHNVVVVVVHDENWIMGVTMLHSSLLLLLLYLY